MIAGKVIESTVNSFLVECDDNKLRNCSIKGKILKESLGYYNPLCPGDNVEIEIDPLDFGKGQIVNLKKRKNAFSRFNQKGKNLQLIASNIDNLICVTTPRNPPFRPRFVDRVLVQGAVERINTIIVVNKIDLELSVDDELRIREWERLGYTVFKVSARKKSGLDKLTAVLENKLSVLVGQSGVGKSSIINALDGTVNLKTGELSIKHDRGAHTTTKGVLLHINFQNIKFDLIDTPGVRNFIPGGIDSTDLIHFFPEMAGLWGQCSYGASCTHTTESGCKIQEAIYSGVILEDRFESYLNLKEELEEEKQKMGFGKKIKK